MSTNVFSGARASFSINDKKVAFASGCEGTEEITYEPADVLDNIEVAEYVPVGYRVNFSASIFRTIDKVPAVVGVGVAPAPHEGALGSLKSPHVGLFPKSTQILTSGVMSATVSDSLTNTTIVKMDEVKATSLNFSISARGLVGQNVSFNAISMRDESEAL